MIEPRSPSARMHGREAVVMGILGLAFWCSGCEETHSETDGAPVKASVAPRSDMFQPTWPGVHFVDITGERGIDFVHEGGSDAYEFIPWAQGGGAGVADYDLDGDLDLYLVSGAHAWPDETTGPLPRNRLYRNNGKGHFEDVTDHAAVGNQGWGTGCAWGDYDDDGFPDLYVVNFGPNALYRNRGDGTFEDVTGPANVGDRLFGNSAAFGDLDSDGDLDLYVLNFVDVALKDITINPENYIEQVLEFQVEAERYRVDRPLDHRAQPNRLYLNQGNGTFDEVARISGADDPSGRGQALLVFDYDGDNDQDIYIANDRSANVLLENDGMGSFRDVARAAGVAGGTGRAREGSMGVIAEDFDGDHRVDLFVTNYRREANSLFLGRAERRFSIDEQRVGSGVASIPEVGWGIASLDPDHDGLPDILVANGHVYRAYEARGECYEQPIQFYRNLGDGFFYDGASIGGPGLLEDIAGRGVIAADFDRDGKPELLVSAVYGSPRLLENQAIPGGHWVSIRLRQDAPNAQAIGSIVTVEAGDIRHTRHVTTSGGFLTSKSLDQHIGLGDEEIVGEVSVVWPDGSRESWEGLRADRSWVLQKGSGDS